MEKYPVKKVGEDFEFIAEINNKGTREKRTALDRDGKKVIFKYQKYNQKCSEACSEKLSYEIAKVLGYACAKIELAMDENQTLGILNYIFVDTRIEEHIDIISYIKKNNAERKVFYTLENIKKCLDELDGKLFYQFIKIMVFDALVGEQDRHEENWGIIRNNRTYTMSPLYDNGCNLLRDFYDDKYAEKFYNGDKDFNAFIKRGKSVIYKENGKQYKHFELIEHIYEQYPIEVKNEIINLEKLTDNKLEEIVRKIPDYMMNQKHKEYIIKYVKRRKEILLEIIQ